MTEMQFPAWISVVCLWPIGVLCLMAIISDHYRDNWLQFFGLVGLMVWAFGRGWVLYTRIDGDVGFSQMLGHVSMLSFAIGTAWKVFRYRKTIVKDGKVQRAQLQ